MIQVGRLHAAQGNSEVAVAALRQAVTLQPGKAAFWSILGVELAKAGTWAQAQHCLVRSLQLETSATAWTNLGAVYMALGEHTLANKAFKEAQAAQPDYVRGWAGQVSPRVFFYCASFCNTIQALLAEALGYKFESLDLLRHCTFLGQVRIDIEAQLMKYCFVIRKRNHRADMGMESHPHWLP